jgi:hypothetical protein
MPLVSSVELKLVRNEIDERVNENFDKFGFNLDFFDNFDINKLNVLLIIKILIFLEIGFDLYLLIYSLINDPYMFFEYFFNYIIIGLIIFPNTIITVLDSIFRGDVTRFLNIMQMYVIGVLILFFIEINPTISNYLIGSIIYGFILQDFLMPMLG